MAIRVIIKIGGSLSQYPELPDLCASLQAYVHRHRLLVMPGGG